MGFDKQNYTRELNNKYSNVARTNLLYMGGIINKAQYDRQLSNIDMPEITAKNEKEEILKNAAVLEEISSDLGSSAILLYDKHHYLKIEHLDELKLLMDKEFQPYRYEVIKAVFLVVAVILLAAYIFVIYKIKPLRKLKRQIVKFANGELDGVQNVGNGKDEISEVSEKFKESKRFSKLDKKYFEDSLNNYLKSKEAFINLFEIWGNSEEIICKISNEKNNIPRFTLQEYAKPISAKILA